jgi:hypothetical protein
MKHQVTFFEVVSSHSRARKHCVGPPRAGTEEETGVPTIRFELAADTTELVDAGEALEALVESRAGGQLDLSPTLLRLLLALDEAIADALRAARAPGL